jgi:hypothetical protein
VSTTFADRIVGIKKIGGMTPTLVDEDEEQMRLQ